MARKFKESKVRFDSGPHEYWLGDERLMGYTSTIGQWMYPHTYDGIPEETLSRAAERGTAIHNGVQFAVDMRARSDIPEVNEGARLLADAGLSVEAWEWIVDDGERFASAIDALCADGAIIDIKTTSELHLPEVSLQLSCYAYWLERMNEKLEVPALYALWLPKRQYGKCALVKVERIPADVIGQVIQGYINGESSERYAEMVRPAGPTLPAEWRSRVAAWYSLQEQLAELQEKERRAKEWLSASFEQMGVKKYEDPFIRITRVEPTTRASVDSARLKKSYPDIYAECQKVSEVKGSIRITLL